MKQHPPCPPAPTQLDSWRAPRPLLDGNDKPYTDRDGILLKRFGVAFGWFDDVLEPAMSSDADLLVTQNGLSLLLEFKHQSEVKNLEAKRKENQKHFSGYKKLGGQRYAQSLLAETGLFVVYMVEYSDQGSGTNPPTITRHVRLTDTGGAWEWKPSSCEVVRQKIWEWRCNAMDMEFVRRQKCAAAYGQYLQVTDPDWKGTQVQFNSLRLTQRAVREDEYNIATYEDFLNAYREALKNDGLAISS